MIEQRQHSVGLTQLEEQANEYLLTILPPESRCLQAMHAGNHYLTSDKKVPIRQCVMRVERRMDIHLIGVKVGQHRK
jgi:hypothetical protein